MSDQVVMTLNATIRPDQMAKLIQFGKDEGKVSKSEALRELLDVAFEQVERVAREKAGLELAEAAA